MGINCCKPKVVVFCGGDDADKVVEGTKKLIIHGSVKKVPEGDWMHGSLFPGRGSIEEVIIEEGVEVIGEHAFNRCKKLKNISLPSSLKEIGNNAFRICSSLTEVDLSHTKVTSIGEDTFYECKKLKNISFPTSLEEIGVRAFSQCYGLIEVDLSHTDLTSISGSAFRYCKNLPKESIIELEKVYKRIYETSKQERGEDHDDTQELKANLAEFQKEYDRYLNEDTEKNLRNLQGFIKSRDNINNISEKVLPNNYMKKRPSLIPQQTLRQSKNSLADIRAL